ncbi:MAG: hypothetical protein ACLR23_20920 [Clostridia bacterium]|jgi:hypothetical protein
MAEGIDRMAERKWGVFTHYLYGVQNNPESPMNQGAGETDWNTCVDELNVDRIAKTLAEVGAGYYFFTLMQGRKYMAAPNTTFDEIAQTKPGEACSLRDLPADIHRALTPYQIDFYLYYTGDGPYKDEPEGARFGFLEPRQNISRDFVDKWASVLQEYATRYGQRVRGWWIDGCYKDAFGYTDDLLELYYTACKKGNPNGIVALNNGVKGYLHKNFAREDFICGEFNDFTVIPDGRYIEGAQAHILAPLGLPTPGNIYDAWCKPGCKRSREYMLEYVKQVNDAGAAVTIDVCLYRDGSFDPAQLEVLDYIGSHI